MEREKLWVSDRARVVWDKFLTRMSDGQDGRRDYILYRGWCSAVQMLSDRKYAIEEKAFAISFEEFRRRAYGGIYTPNYDSIAISCPHPQNPSHRVRVLFLDPGSLAHVGATMHRLCAQKVRRCILVLDCGRIPDDKLVSLRNWISGTLDASLELELEVFSIHGLFRNPARLNWDARLYQLVTPAEKEQLIEDMDIILGRKGDKSKRDSMKELKVTFEWPDIWLTRYFDLKHGDVLKITVPDTLVNVLKAEKVDFDFDPSDVQYLVYP